MLTRQPVIRHTLRQQRNKTIHKVIIYICLGGKGLWWFSNVLCRKHNTRLFLYRNGKTVARKKRRRMAKPRAPPSHSSPFANLGNAESFEASQATGHNLHRLDSLHAALNDSNNN